MAYYSLTNGTLDFTQVNENDDNKSLLTFYFVNPAGNRDGMDDLMKLAYEATVEKFPPKDAVKVLSESECCNLPKAQLKSRDSVNIFVFTDFNKKNEAFNYILTNKTVYILGSRCLLTILLENIPTPADIYHIHNLSMKNLVITTTSMTKEEKMQIKELVNFMGGNYIDTLKEAVTHLVSSSVRSVKYEAATKNGIVVMHPKWVESVWEKCQSSTENIVANDKSFNRFKLPVFYNLRITSTGYKVPERNRIKEQVESAGGTYSLSFTKEIDILIMEKDSVDSEKCKMAIKLNKFCLSSAWITESVDKGYAVPFTSYIIKGALKASTPTKDTNVTISKFNPDCTEISQISFATSNRTINMRETQWNETFKQPSTTPDTNQQKYKGWLEKITLADAKKCGNILDGFNFFLSGFTAEEVQFLGKVLSVLGGTKVDNIKDQVTHVIVGATDNRLFLVLDDNNIDPSILSVEWIQKVVEQKGLIAEPPFEIKRLIRINPSTSNPSPASKKAMRSLNGEFKKPTVSKLQLEQKQKAENDKDMELVSQYLGPPKIASVSQSVEEEDDMFIPFLTGKYVFVFGFTESNQSAQVIENCELLGATLVDHTFDKEVDYAITDSIPLPSIEPPIKKYKHLVTNLWLVESLEIGGAIDISFYHRPVAKVVEEPLKGETLVVTNYKGNERKYIHVLVEALGGKCSEVLRKFEEAILVTPTATGKKFESAKAWNAAVVKLDWLLECITKKRRVDETPYLIGGTSPSNRNIRNNESIVFSSQDVYDDHDPPIENYNDDPELDGKMKTPIRAVPSRLMNFNGKPLTPEGSPNLNISRLLVDMPTPQREVTRAALLEARKPVESPRKLRLEKLAFTPTTKSKNLIDDVSSPTPQFPPCMRKLSRDYGIRPDSSPATQAFHKRKLEALDQNYRSPPKRSRAEPKQNEVPTPPLSHRRYDFFKARIQGYDSPDPRKNTQLLIDTNRPKANVTEEASKFLNIGDDETALKPAEVNTETDDAFKPFNELEVQKTNESSKKGFNLQKMIEEEMRDTEGQAPFIAPFESEALVEWKDQSDSNDSAKSRKSEEPCQSGSTAINKGSGHVFAINGLDEAKKADFTKRITKLGGKCDNVNFTHLIAQTPNRSEKFLSSIACGRFIVHPNYILECEKEGRFVDESKYEFGNPLFVPSIDKNMDQQGFKAPFNWRKWIKLDRRSQYEFGAFTGMNFVIAASPEKTDQMKNIIVSGGGKFVDVDFKAKLNMAYIKINHVNYCLFEAPKYLSEENKKILKLCKVESCSFKVVPLYLMSSEPPVDFP